MCKLVLLSPTDTGVGRRMCKLSETVSGSAFTTSLLRLKLTSSGLGENGNTLSKPFARMSAVVPLVRYVEVVPPSRQ